MENFDPKRTVVVLNLPSSIDEDDLQIHFQKAKHGGGDVDEVELRKDGTAAFVIFYDSEGLKLYYIDNILNDLRTFGITCARTVLL